MRRDPQTRRAAGLRRDLRALVTELTVVGTVYVVYRAGRSISRSAADAAHRNAADVVHLERALGIANEASVQQWALGSRTLVEMLNRYYVSVHFPITIAFLVWAYVRHPEAYRTVRTWFVGVTMTALVIHVVYPLAPPRMSQGFVDTLREFGPRIYHADPRMSVANQYAAMPSLHFGWALMLSVGFIVIKRSLKSLLVVVHPFVTLLAIVATGNHYWSDAIVVTLLAAGVGALVLTARPRAVEMLPSAVSTAALASVSRRGQPARAAIDRTRTPTSPGVDRSDSRERVPIGRGIQLAGTSPTGGEPVPPPVSGSVSPSVSGDPVP